MSQFEEQKQEDERIESTENLVNVSLEAVAANRESLEATDDAPDDARPFEINVADRIKKLPPYLFAELNALKYAKRREGADVVDLGMGSPTDPPAQSVIDKLAEAVKNPKVHRYGASRGIKNLRAEMAARYLKYYGVRLNPDTEIMATLGSKDALSHTILALCGPGDLAIVPSPYFPAHLYAVMLAGGETLAIDVRNPERLLSEVAYACERFLPRPKLMIVNFPHNPTATVVDQEFYVDLVRLAKKYGFMVLSDLAYADIVFDGYVGYRFRRLRYAEFPRGSGRERRRGRNDDHVEELQYGGLAHRILLREFGNRARARDD